MLKIFKTFTPQTIIVILIFTIIIKSIYLIAPVNLQAIENVDTLNWINQLIIEKFNNFPRINQTIGTLLIVTQALIINRLCTEYKLFQQDTFIPAALFILLTSLSPWYNTLSAQMISSTILLFLVNNTLRIHSTSMPKKLMFNNGLFIGLASLIYLPTAIILPFFIWAYAISKKFDIKEIIAFLLGAMCICYVTITTGFLLEINLYPILNAPRLFQQPELIFLHNHWIPITCIALLTAIGLFSMSKHYSKSIESIKKMWLTIVIFLIAGAALPYIQWTNTTANWHFFLIPGSMIIANIWMSELNKWIKILLFWITIACIAMTQYNHLITN